MTWGETGITVNKTSWLLLRNQKTWHHTSGNPSLITNTHWTLVYDSDSDAVSVQWISPPSNTRAEKERGLQDGPLMIHFRHFTCIFCSCFHNHVKIPQSSHWWLFGSFERSNQKGSEHPGWRWHDAHSLGGLSRTYWGSSAHMQ